MDEDVPGLPWFTLDLGALRDLYGEPSLHELNRISRRVPELYGQPFSRLPVLTVPVLSRLHAGRRRTSPGWTVVASYVLSSQYFGATTAGLLIYDPGPETLPEWRHWHSLASGPRPDQTPPYASLPLRKPHRPARDAASGMLVPGSLPPSPSLRLEPGDDQALIDRLTRRYRSTPPTQKPKDDRQGPGGTGSTSGPEGTLAAPTPARELAGHPGTQRSVTQRSVTQQTPRRRLPTVDELLEGMTHEQHRAPSRQRTATGMPFYGGAEPPPDTLIAIRPSPQPRDRDRCRQMFGSHGIALLKAAEYGDADAAVRLGVLYCCAGFRAESDRWLAIAAGHEDVAAITLRAVRSGYRRSIAAEIAYDLALPPAHRVPRHGDGDDYAYAAEVYYRAAADCGHVDAAYRLALLCQARGNDMEAGYWAAQAARDGHPLGQHKFEAIYHAMITEGFWLGPFTALPHPSAGLQPET